ncbi:sterol desaturase family protein [Kineosporia babensis]|uniref:Sterol desaturase family protein n=1 Tax=Kineosporia babensis TaxID=499548 RepID=A0A9X1NLC7_9ACTN|nr:sterol desaturase family protein [Kineosporia babensis]MCD5315841.1 sterol desaturase family protein [Kineosporia babensis]
MPQQPAQSPARTNRVSGRNLLQHSVYPALWAMIAGAGFAALGLGWDLPTVSAGFLVAVLLYLTLLERALPFDTAWQPQPREWIFYGIFFGFTMAGGALAQFLTALAVQSLATVSPSWPMPVQVPLALLISSLAGYLVHRLGHRSPLLWRFHGVHHTPGKVNVANNGVNHVLDVAFAQFVIQIGLVVGGFSAPAVFLAGLFTTAHGYFAHANVDVRLGRLNYLVVGPEQHRLHHSTDLTEAGHYGSEIPLWDHLFGTYTWLPGRVPVAVGLSDPGAFPGEFAPVASLLHPFRRRRPSPASPLVLEDLR